MTIVKFEKKVFKNGGSFAIIIPHDIMRTLGIENRETIEIYVKDTSIVISKK